MNRVYRKKYYNLYQFGNEYIIHNTRKEFKDGHTHINEYKTAVFLIDVALHKSIPKHLCNYHLESLYRISEDRLYKDKLMRLKESRKKKKRSYNHART